MPDMPGMGYGGQDFGMERARAPMSRTMQLMNDGLRLV